MPFNYIIFIQLFNLVQEKDPFYKLKIKYMNGNLQQLKLDLNEDDIKTVIENVQIVIHCGAVTTSAMFNEPPLKKAVEIIVRGTLELLRIAENIKELESFVYVSTVFSNCNRTHIGECFYDSSDNTDSLLTFVELFNGNNTKRLEYWTKEFLKEHPNIDTYTRAHAENIVKKFRKFPAAVVRPSIG